MNVVTKRLPRRTAQQAPTKQYRCEEVSGKGQGGAQAKRREAVKDSGHSRVHAMPPETDQRRRQQHHNVERT